METVALSGAALELLRLHFAGRYLSMRRSNLQSLPGRTADETLNAYREVVSAGLMVPVSTCAGGPEAIYRLTHEGDKKEHGPSAPPLGLVVRDGSENEPNRFADRELRFRRVQQALCRRDRSAGFPGCGTVTDRNSFLMLDADPAPELISCFRAFEAAVAL